MLNQRFNRLLVLAHIKGALWGCQCDCGKIVNIRTSSLKNGKIKSCGCLKNEGNNKSHGLSKTRFFSIWSHMKNRCLNERNNRYQYYGGRGITVCDRWLKFENFRDDMYESYLEHCNEYGEKNTSIDRIDVFFSP